MKDKELSIEPLTVDVKMAAKMLSICERTLRSITKRGELPVIRIGNRVLYSREDLIKFVRQRSRREQDSEEEKDTPQEMT